MKIALLLVLLSGALVLGGCVDTSLQTDEDYRATKGPAPYSPDYTRTLPGY
jgi:hypothetical protein